ncbi:hypothetical protein CAMSH0001_0271 [Campylobacter showae RM3277]|uniref:Uncharacterized protein n=1 Tax=Campylobacter showae RM3277 TaxID=553219 RepID=C6RIB9_9BACT|nr:hypothetical protein CAMSH0001_0271 [Campylobacter showae RM3277]
MLDLKVHRKFNTLKFCAKFINLAKAIPPKPRPPAKHRKI